MSKWDRDLGVLFLGGVLERSLGLKVRMGPGPTFPVEKEIPVISPVLTVRPLQIGAPPWQSMRPVDEQEVRQVCSDRHETCTFIFQLFEIYNLAY